MQSTRRQPANLALQSARARVFRSLLANRRRRREHNHSRRSNSITSNEPSARSATSAVVVVFGRLPTSRDSKTANDLSKLAAVCKRALISELTTKKWARRSFGPLKIVTSSRLSPFETCVSSVDNDNGGASKTKERAQLQSSD